MLKRLIFFIVFIFTITLIYGQDSYNVFTLEYFKKSLDDLIFGDYDSAIFNSTNVIKRDPNSSVAYTIRGRAYYEKNVMNNAISDCSEAIKLDKNNISALSIRANAYVKTGDMKRAIADWEAILRIYPDNFDAKQNIELAQRKQ
jgi:tetratricopeptide (TPR) repeat protein